MDSIDDSIPLLGEDDEDLEPGKVVGDYVVDAKIGEGGFGTVFRATHPVIGKEVAIKVLARQFSARRDMVSRFVNEARAVIEIGHRHIIDIFAFGQLDDGRHYYVMELLKGQDLDSYLGAQGPLSIGETVALLRPIAKALDAAHGKGVAHRDLKPENIFLTADADGEVFPKLLDFGIAKLLGDDVQEHKTATGAPMGTPKYMSPEQCRGRDVDHRTDIYAFGILVYEMLTGTTPFDGDTYVEVLLKQISEEPTAPSSHVEGLPLSVDKAILSMLAKDADKRPPNLRAALGTLECAAAEAGIDLPVGLAATFITSSQAPSRRHSPAIDPTLPSGAGIGIAVSPTMAEKVSASEKDSDSSSENDDIVPANQPSRGKLVAASIVALTGMVAAFFVLRGNPADSAASEAAKAASKAPRTEPAVAVEPETAVEPAIARESEPEPEPALVVSVTVEGPPAGTEVYGPHGLLGVAPGKVRLDHGNTPVRLTFKADGYQTTAHELLPSEDMTIKVTLIAKSKGKKTRPKNTKTKHKDRDEIENPFTGK